MCVSSIYQHTPVAGNQIKKPFGPASNNNNGRMSATRTPRTPIGNPTLSAPNPQILNNNTRFLFSLPNQKIRLHDETTTKKNHSLYQVEVASYTFLFFPPFGGQLTSFVNFFQSKTTCVADAPDITTTATCVWIRILIANLPPNWPQY